MFWYFGWLTDVKTFFSLNNFVFIYYIIYYYFKTLKVL